MVSSVWEHHPRRRGQEMATTDQDLPDLEALVGLIVRARRRDLMKDELHHRERKCLRYLYLQSALF